MARRYGADSPRHCYAGRAATRAITMQSIDANDINEDISDFSAEQLQTLDKRLRFYLRKFKKVGTFAAKHRPEHDGL